MTILVEHISPTKIHYFFAQTFALFINYSFLTVKVVKPLLPMLRKGRG